MDVSNESVSLGLEMNGQNLSCPADPERISSLALLRAFTLFSIQL